MADLALPDEYPNAFKEYGSFFYDDGMLKMTSGYYFMDGISEPNMFDGEWIYLETTFQARDVSTNDVTVLLSIGTEAEWPYEEGEWMQIGCLADISEVQNSKETRLNSARWIYDFDSRPYDDLWATNPYGGMPEYFMDQVIERETEKILFNFEGSITVGCSLPIPVAMLNVDNFGDEHDFIIGSRLLVDGMGYFGRTSPIDTIEIPEGDDIYDGYTIREVQDMFMEDYYKMVGWDMPEDMEREDKKDGDDWDWEKDLEKDWDEAMEDWEKEWENEWEDWDEKEWDEWAKDQWDEDALEDLFDKDWNDDYWHTDGANLITVSAIALTTVAGMLSI